MNKQTTVKQNATIKTQNKTTKALFLLAGLLSFSSLSATPIPLDRSPDSIRNISLPESEYQEEINIPIGGPWKLVSSANGKRTWEAPLPIRTRSLFFSSPPSGMNIYHRDGEKIPWSDARSVPFKKREVAKRDSKGSYWNYSAKSLRITRSISAGRPSAWEYSMIYPKATTRERILVDTNIGNKEQFVARQQQVDDHTQHGLYLPVPTMIEHKVTIPQNAVFETNAFILPPEASDPLDQTDGATLSLSILENDERLLYQEFQISLERKKIRVDLKKFAGKDVSFVLQSADANPKLDYVFLHDPIIRESKKQPERMIWVFIDTLRKDHLSLYGYNRPTTPKLDAWAKENAAYYSAARSIAPWTLPSSRTMVTGHLPERWGSVPTLQKQLATAGWFTSFLTGNIYLSSNFEGQVDWTSHRCVNWPLAEVQVERAEKVLAEHSDRDVFMMLHFMDMHLPYTEPISYRYQFAGEAPKALSSYEFSRSAVVRAEKKFQDGDKEYIIGRYDNNLRYIDDVLTPFLENLPENSTIVIFSDHGEEFWDHDDFEHGHSLHDELLNVPFIIKTKDITKGLHTEPISLLDLMPTSARATGITIEETQGWALQDHSTAELEARPQAFGRLLYGDDAWGSLYQDIKYISGSGKEQFFNLKTDAAEQINMNRSSELIATSRKALSMALDREVELGFRLVLKGPSRSKKEVSVIFNLDDGVKKAWRGSDPTKKTDLSVDGDDDVIVFTWGPKFRSTREAFLVPQSTPLEVLENLNMELLVGNKRKEFLPLFINPPKYDGKETLLAKAQLDGYTAKLSYTILPIPSDDDLELDAFDDEVSEELKLLGYME